MFLNLLIFLIFFIFIIMLFFSKGHFFSLLISFEGIMLFVFFYYSFYLTNFSMSMESILIILSLMVMEGVMGLSILIYSVNWFGRDFIFISSSK